MSNSLYNRTITTSTRPYTSNVYGAFSAKMSVQEPTRNDKYGMTSSLLGSKVGCNLNKVPSGLNLGIMTSTMDYYPSKLLATSPSTNSLCR